MGKDSFANQKPRVATEKDCKARWDGIPDGKSFRCYLCGYKFKVGDVWRWIWGKGSYMQDGKKCGVTNLTVCESCDQSDKNGLGPMERWIKLHEEYSKDKFWTFREQ